MNCLSESFNSSILITLIVQEMTILAHLLNEEGVVGTVVAPKAGCAGVRCHLSGVVPARAVILTVIRRLAVLNKRILTTKPVK
jgi:hypothetical protein